MSIPATTVIKAKAVIDGTSDKPLEHAAVIVEGDTIKEVVQGDLSGLPSGPHVRTLDYPNGYLLPGMVDAHTHLIFGEYGSSYEEVMENDSDQILLMRAARNALTHLHAGVTTMRENGARNRVTFDLREGARRGYATTPRLYLCGRPVTLTGGHFYWCNQEADGEDGVRAAVRELVKDGADHIKIMASGGGTAITDNRRTSYSVEELRAIVDEAHNFGKLTTAHCLATESLTNALEAGVDMIEHAGFIEPDGSFKFDQHIAERIAEQGVYVSPTVQTGYRQREALQARELGAPSHRGGTGPTGRPQGQVRKPDGVSWAYVDGMRHQHHLRHRRHSDLRRLLPGARAYGRIRHEQHGRNSRFYQRGRPSPSAPGDIFGSLTPGMGADMVVVDKDPLEDIRALRSMTMVMRAGEQIV